RRRHDPVGNAPQKADFYPLDRHGRAEIESDIQVSLIEPDPLTVPESRGAALAIDEMLASAVQEVLDTPNEIALEFFLVLQTFSFHYGLSDRTLLPALFLYFVASDVDVLAGE